MFSSAPFSLWPLDKQYNAAQYYLNTQNSLSFINEAQKSKLMALHMQIVYGSCKEGILLPEIQNCSQAERKRRFHDWKQLGTENRVPSMRKFIDLMHNLFPNWFKNPKLYTEFELEWISLQRIKIPTSDESIPSPNLSADREESLLKPYSKNLLKSSSTPTHSGIQKPFYNTSEVASAIKTVRSGNHEISAFKFNKDMYKQRYIDSSEKETVDCTPIILRNLFENLESQRSGKKSKKLESPRDTFSSLPQRSKNNESLEQCIERIKQLLIALEENSNEAYEGEGNALENAVDQFETDVVESILRPKLQLLSGVIKEIELIFKSELSSKVKLVAEIHLKFVNAIENVFQYLQALDKSKLELNQQKQNSEKTAKMLEQGFLAIRELNDPANSRYSLYGVTKLSKAMYMQNLQASKQYLPQEDVDIMIDIETMLANNEERNNNLLSELKQRDNEILKLKKLLRDVQEKSYKDNLELANQCKRLKESLGLRRGNKNQDMDFDISYKVENEVLKNEIEQLKLEKFNAIHESIQNKLRS